LKKSPVKNMDDSYLHYLERRLGMDHERYAFSMLQQRAPMIWPNAAPVALLIVLPVQFFPLNQRGVPFKVPGGMSTPYPDLRHASLRDYGNRVGIFRILQALDRYGFQASYAVNSDLIERAPSLLRDLSARGEIICHGQNMDCLHYGGLARAAEQAQIELPLTRLQEFTGKRVSGWLSPAKSQSENTPDLLKAAGIDYCLDWVNDELPYYQNTHSGALVALPLSTELEDRFVIMHNQHSEQSWCEQVCDAYDFLRQEAKSTGAGRMLTLTIHPWLMGQAHRMIWLERALAFIAAAGGYWNAQAGQIVWHFEQQAAKPGTPCSHEL
jgi:allantoinase